MAVPELYWYGKEGKWFGIRQFGVYMFDGVLQVRYIFACYTQDSTLTSLSVCDHILSDSVYIFYYLLSSRCLASHIKRVLHGQYPLSRYITWCLHSIPSDYGLFRCLHCQSLQRSQYKCLDWLGLLCCLHRQSPCMGIHRKFLCHICQAFTNHNVVRPSTIS